MRNSLKGTIDPYVTIDEFTPKSGNSSEIAVVSFYAIDLAPAKDLNTFLQRGYTEIIDTEVSPNPDENGKYLVFVEIERDANFSEVLRFVVKEITNLTGEQEWMVKPFAAQEAYAIDDERLNRYIAFNQRKITHESVQNFLQESYVSNLTFDESYVKFNSQIQGKICKFGNENHVIKSLSLSESALKLVDRPREVDALNAILGDNFAVNRCGKYTIITNESNNILVLEDTIFVY